MPSPLMPDHGTESRGVVVWIGHYQVLTPGVRGEDNTSTRLDPGSEVQPDHNLRIRPECGGQSGPPASSSSVVPELIIEVARSSLRIDLGPKKDQYERAGVREYLVVALDPDEIHWFILRDGRFHRLAPGPGGIYRSEVFPGLWLDPAALFAEDLPRLVAAVDLGVATPEHAAFVARLDETRRRPRP